MKPPLVSVIIPAHNSAAYLAEAIESALAQTHSPLEIIVVDDGSTDNTNDVIQSFTPRVVAARMSNGWPGAARNRGLSTARGEFIQFLDADDLLLPSKIADSLAVFDPEIGAVVSEKEFFESSSTPSVSPPRDIGQAVLPVDVDDALAFVLNTRIGTPGPLHRTSCVREAGGFREDIRNLEDIEFHLRLATAGVRFRRLASVLVRCRHHNSPGRLRAAADRNVVAITAVLIMLEHARCTGNLTHAVKTSLADRLANYGRKAYVDGYTVIGKCAMKEARTLNRFPRPTQFWSYNILAWTLGVPTIERLRMVVRALGRVG